ncbi:MAG TPA: PhzF family phenazine biosynthesis protein [Gemmatimonadales bacterium]|nr:PhzF family phenazine biosynthesis protein [Gemmatimonadales bacterium]
MALSLAIVDAFTDKPFSGNPAAVCRLTADRDARWMQNVAREMNLSETAFVVPRGDFWALRWFTPTLEIDLCGHATLATAHVLWESGAVPDGSAIGFRTRSGMLGAKRSGEWIELDFPALPTAPADAPPDLLDGIGARPVAVAQSTYDYLVELENEASVRDLEPDLSLIARVPARGVIVTAAATTPGFDFVSRFFGPRSGVPEDPVTGSAHCALAPYWQQKLGRDQLLAYQASPRGGIVRVEVRGERVALGGKAVTVLRGELRDV